MHTNTHHCQHFTFGLKAKPVLFERDKRLLAAAQAAKKNCKETFENFSFSFSFENWIKLKRNNG